MSAPAPGTAPGVVRVRLMGSPDSVSAVAELLTHLAAGLDPCGRQPCLPAIALIETSAPYPNRRDPGMRVYLTIAARPATASHNQPGPGTAAATRRPRPGPTRRAQLGPTHPPAPPPPAKEHLS